MKFENRVAENIENQISKIEEKRVLLKRKSKNLWITPSIDDVEAYCLKATYKQFIRDHIDNINSFLCKRISEKSTLFYILFKSNELYKKPLASRNVISY